MLTLTIRPVSTFCNAKCHYCYLGDQTQDPKHLMSLNTLDLLISKYQQEREYCRYVWHGGEPTLAGLDFYQNVLELQDKYKSPKSIQIRNSIQSNGYNINSEWIKFLGKYKFDIGISLDGPESINDNQRGKKAYQRTMNAVNLLQEAKIPFAIICVITKHSVSYPDELFDFYNKIGVHTIAFNPIFGENPDYDIVPSDFAVFMKRIYDRWVDLDDPSLNIRFLKEAVLGMLGGTVDLCMMQGGCNNHLIVESDGRILPCHTFSENTLQVGHVDHDEFERVAQHKYFVPVQAHVDNNCCSCRWYNLCGGDCVRFLTYSEDSFYGTPFFRTFPEIKIIQILRDPRSIFASKNSTVKPYPWIFLVRRWRKHALLFWLYKHHFTKNVFCIKYEELIKKPEKTCEKICTFLDIPLDKNMLSPKNYIDGFGNPWLQNSSFSEKKSEFSVASLLRWKKVLTEYEIKFLEHTCFVEMSLNGYKTSTQFDISFFEKMIFEPPIIPNSKLSEWIKIYTPSNKTDTILEMTKEWLRAKLLLMDNINDIDIVENCFLSKEIYLEWLKQKALHL